MSLPDLAIRRPVFITVIFMIVALLGATSFFQLPVDLMPDVAFPTISVTTNYEGVGPQEMEELITIPLERAMSSTPGIKEITSRSSEGSSRVRVSFEWGTDVDEAANELRTRVDRVRGQLPEDASTPYLFKYDISVFPVMFLGINSPMHPRELREFAEKQIRYRLERIPGVAQADVWGGLVRQIHVVMNRAKLHTLRISPSQLMTALRRENINEPAGQVLEGDFEVLVRTQGEYASLEEIRRTMVTRRGGTPIYVEDIATVEDSHQEVRNLVRINDLPGIRMSIRKQAGSNTVHVSEAVRSAIERINTDFPQVRMYPLYDTSKFITRAVANVRDAAIYGSILAVIVLMLFLRNLRSTFVIALSIPISILAAFGLMFFCGFTLNTVTFGGLALGVGVLVDNAIVVLENIFRHRQDGEEKKAAAANGAKEVALAITASTLTTVAVFLPVVFMTGMAGVIFQQLAWVVSFSLFSSLLVSLTLVPFLSSKFVRVREPNPKSLSYSFIHFTSNILKALDKNYASSIRWSLQHPILIITTAVLLVASTSYLVPYIGFELEPETDEGQVRASLELPEGTRLGVTNQVALRAEQIVKEQIPELADLQIEVGSAGGWRTANTNRASMSIYLVDQDQRERSSQEIAIALRRQFVRFPGVISRVRSSGGLSLMRRGGDQEERLSLDIRGYDMTDAYALAVEIKRLMESTEGISDARISRSPGRPENQIKVDREKAASMGLSVSNVATTVRAAIGGTVAGYFRERGEEYDILVRYQEKDRMINEDVLAVPVQTPAGMVVPLQSLVKLERSEGPISIERKDQQRVITVSANLSGTRDMGSIVADVQEQFRGFKRSSRLCPCLLGRVGRTAGGVLYPSDQLWLGHYSGLPSHGSPVRIVQISVLDHVLYSSSFHRRCSHAVSE